MKKLLSILLALVLLVALLPTTIFATNNTDTESVGDYTLRVYYSDDAASVYETPALGLWPLYTDLTAGQTYVPFGGTWDRDYLYLAYRRQKDDPAATITIGETVVEGAAIKHTATHTLMKIPFESVGIFMDNFGYTTKMSVEVNNLSWSGKLIFSGSRDANLLSQGVVGYGSYTGKSSVTQEGDTFLMKVEANCTDSWDSFSNFNVQELEALYCGEEDTVLEFDIDPVNFAKARRPRDVSGDWSIAQGFCVSIGDQTSGLQYPNSFVFAIQNFNGSIHVVYDAKDPVVVDTGIPGSTKDNIHVRVEYDNNASISTDGVWNKANAKIYINSKLVCIGEDVKDKKIPAARPTYILCSLTTDGIQESEIVVSNLTLGKLVPEEMDTGVLKALTFKTFKGENYSEGSIFADLALPEFLPGGQLNGIALEWSSDNEAAITSDGKVTIGVENPEVALTAKIKGTDVSKTFYLTASNGKIDATSVGSVKQDGKLNDSAWRFSSVLKGTGNPLDFGALWTNDSLYLGMDKADASDLILLVDGKKVEAPVIKTGDEYMEIKASLTDLGITPAVGGSCPLTIMLAGVEWSGTLNFGKASGIEVITVSVDYSSLFLIGLAVCAVIFFALLVLAILKNLYKKVWFIIILVVLVVGGTFCGIASGYKPENVNANVNLGGTVYPEYQLPESELGALLPVPESKYGAVIANTEDCFLLDVQNVSPEDFKVYVAACKETTFRTPVDVTELSYVAKDSEKRTLSAIYVENEARMYVSVYTKYYLPNLSYENLLGEEAVSTAVVNDMILSNSAITGQASTYMDITWTSSNPKVISAEGKVNRPDNGVNVVTLTATINSTGEQKMFTFRVPGYDYNEGTLVVLNDTNPAGNSGIYTDDVIFTWDTTNNSVITDLGKKQTVNYALLRDHDGITRVVPSYTSLWISNDNVTYTRVEDFKMILRDGVWYFHDFEVEARFVKIHYGLYDAVDTSFVGGLGEMIRAGYEENFGSNGATFTTTEYVLKNTTGKDTKDYAWRITKADLGITTTNNDSIRIYVDGKLQYFFVDGNDVVVRIKDLAKDASVTLTVMQSESANIMNLADKEGVYEVTYGTKEIWTGALANHGRNIISFPKGTKWPDGTVLEEDTMFSSSGSSWMASTDDGFTWVPVGVVVNNADPGKEAVPSPDFPRGFLVDDVTNRIFIHTFIHRDPVEINGESFRRLDMRIAYSDNGGVTWNKTGDLPFSMNPRDGLLALQAYGDGLTLSTHDGYGPNIDLIFGVTCLPHEPEVTESESAVRVAYSRDMGETWEFSDIIYSEAPASEEAGAGEANLIEREDGVLVMLTKYTNGEWEDGKFFINYSSDHGVTWQKWNEESDIFAPATQPATEVMNINGVDVQTLSWGGNNALGSRRYVRGPLVFANTTNGETFRNMQNIGFRSTQEVVYLTDMMYVTNHSAEKLANGNFRAGWANGDTSYYMHMTDFDDWYTRTKGAYDSFEGGIAKYEGWFAVGGDIQTSWEQATDGLASLHMERIYQIGRSIPYLQDGKVTVNLYASDKTKFVMELQSAFTDREGTTAAPVGIEVKNNEIIFQNSNADTGLALNPGWNTLTFELKLTEGKATFQLNDGEAVDLPVNPDAERNDVCYFAIMGKSEIYLDEFMVESYLEPTLVAAEGDKEAADAVVELIKAMGTDKAKIEAARDAYNKLNQVQKDFVNRKEYVSGQWINYYDVLVAAENG